MLTATLALGPVPEPETPCDAVDCEALQSNIDQQHGVVDALGEAVATAADAVDDAQADVTAAEDLVVGAELHVDVTEAHLGEAIEAFQAASDAYGEDPSDINLIKLLMAMDNVTAAMAEFGRRARRPGVGE